MVAMKPKEPQSQFVLDLDEVDVSYGSHRVVKRVSLHLENGQVGCLLGPSGCGKSTLLRAIAGFESVTHGKITMLGKEMSSKSTQVPPELRNIGMVFQDIALFPHLTVEQNIAFGIQSLPAHERKARVTELLSLVGLEHTESRYPNSLSGGQQQRIALARALAPKPTLLLMDEPFSGLDATLKETLVPDIRRILVKENITAIVVTHDQMEAFAIADKVAVMNNGCLEQYSAPFELYHLPETRFVADFIGQGDFLSAEILNQGQINTELGILNLTDPHNFSDNTIVDVLVRPDDVLHDDESNFFGVIISKQFRGTYFQYQVELTNGQKLLCLASSHHNHALGERIGIKLDLDHIMLFEAQGKG